MTLFLQFKYNLLSVRLLLSGDASIVYFI